MSRRAPEPTSASAALLLRAVDEQNRTHEGMLVYLDAETLTNALRLEMSGFVRVVRQLHGYGRIIVTPAGIGIAGDAERELNRRLFGEG